ncbi:MAG TPA: hypothetical protein VMJ32_04610 [Pirellulales bacterium]|nr:hypothetical protein [Pirellulales bacterium]
MTASQLAYAAAYINLGLRWRFSWYWRALISRLGRLSIPSTIPDDVPFSISEVMPEVSDNNAAQDNGKLLTMERITLGHLFDLHPGDYHSVGVLSRGNVPIISCGEENNGVCGYFDVEHAYSHRLTIAFNGATLAAKYHPYKFAAKDDVAVCIPKQPLRITTLLFIQVMLRREQWRFSYYRKCFKEKLERVTVPLPAKSGKLDESAIENIMRSSRYWDYLHPRLHPNSKN